MNDLQANSVSSSVSLSHSLNSSSVNSGLLDPSARHTHTGPAVPVPNPHLPQPQPAQPPIARNHVHRAVQSHQSPNLNPARLEHRNSVRGNHLGGDPMRELLANAKREPRNECVWWSVEVAIVFYMLLIAALWLYCTDNFSEFVDRCSDLFGSAFGRASEHLSL